LELRPLGYVKSGEGKLMLVIEESQAKTIKFMYDSYLHDIPLYILIEQAFKLGFKARGNICS
jgi:hypothetical protein